MKTSDFKYDLPQELIAQTPLLERSKSRMMVVDKLTGIIEHKDFENILDYIDEGDTIVLNDTRVIPARLFGHREGKEEIIEFLLTKQFENDKWETLVKPGRKAKIGTEIIFDKNLLTAEVIDILYEGERIIKFKYDGIFNEILDKLGTMPLPPYITEKLDDKDRYQTVYNKNAGSAAAPTAGLHFTNDILNKLNTKKVNIAYVTLHVGIGTFRPVKVDDVLNHKMHSETFNINEETAYVINETKKKGNKIICVGTTSCRVLESATDDKGIIHSMSKETDIFIYPGYKFKIVDMLLTNFHLPESTLIMLVSSLCTKEIILSAYNEAVAEKYRFFSFGDCMLIK
ncbi:MAG: tRNA preQ1(34) S-adenosylmethionine ribosyltransferase-isomerase QueA [Clostridia bacterium]|nr:tRNA preQ1(34) S-adenosylmethionine ribosyltransferase-isomerase QueA [Clostridia bacterium]MDD4386908.1 tRNA preQ1(34) S-adenosylmethionine ribosyltransferase-isomerase QueA [Clostridia bacterium]